MGCKIKFVCLFLLISLSFSGCMRTVEQMYCLPKRSEEYNNLQSEIDGAMQGLEYCAPLSGENQQAVQMVDLDGDGIQEYLLFAKGNSTLPLRILIFREENDHYIHVQTIESNGSSFDQVEYVQMDDFGGMEIVVGSQLADQVLRSVSVYTFNSNMEASLMMTANYAKFLTVDLDEDGLSELFVLRPGQTETDNGIAELYGIENGAMERSNEVNMSGPCENLKRVIVGNLYHGEPAVYVASSIDETALITDVYACVEDVLSNVSLSNESGTSVQTMRNYYVYADDVDNDGVVELPSLITMKPIGDETITDRHDLIRWYAMTLDGAEQDKQYTYHNYVGGWFLELDSRIAKQLSVVHIGNQYVFYLWDKDYQNSEKIMTLYALTGQKRTENGITEKRVVIYTTESVIYSVSLEPAAALYGITEQLVIDSFHLIQQDWKTGET